MNVDITKLDTWKPRLIMALLYIFVLLIAWNLSQLTWLVLLPWTAATSSTASAIPSSANRDYRAMAQRVISAHLFGRPYSPVTATIQPDTRRGLVLLGTYALGNGRGYAFIAPAKGQSAKIFAPGDELPGNITLSQVLSDRVLLKTEQGEETLRIVKLNGDHAPLLLSTPSSATTASLENVRRQLLTNPMELRLYFNAVPVTDNGTVKGFRVAPGPDPTLFRSLGLQAGDVVTAINGVPISNPTRLSELLAKLRTATQITLAVDRNGKRFTIERTFK